MPTDITVALIEVVPRVLWVLFVVTVAALFYRQIRDDILPRISGFNAFGVEATFVRETMDRAIERGSVAVSDADRAQAVRRLGRVKDAFTGARVLWLDDAPEDRSDERAMLRYTGARVEEARSGDEARRMLEEARYDAVVTAVQDGDASPDRMAGVQGISPPVIVYACDGDPVRPAPAGAFAVADRPDQLLHCVADALERARI